MPDAVEREEAVERRRRTLEEGCGFDEVGPVPVPDGAADVLRRELREDRRTVLVVVLRGVALRELPLTLRGYLRPDVVAHGVLSCVSAGGGGLCSGPSG